MRRIIFGTVVAFALASVIGQAAVRADTLALHVDFDKLPPGTAVTIAINIGKIPTATATGTASASGVAALTLGLGTLTKTDTTAVDVYRGDCPNKQVRLTIILAGGTPPNNCNDRKVAAAFILCKHLKWTVHPMGDLGMSSSLFTTRNEIIGAAGLGAIVAAVLVVGGDDTSTGGTGGTGGTGPGGTSPTGTYAFLNKSFTVTVTQVVNTLQGCMAFNATAVDVITPNVNTSSGIGTMLTVEGSTQLQFTATSALGTTANTGTVVGTLGSIAFGSNSFSVVAELLVSATSTQYEETFTGLNGTCAGRTVSYSGEKTN